MRKSIGIALLLAMASGALLLAACSSDGDVGPVEDRVSAVESDLAALLPPPTEHFIEVTAFEVKGATSANDLAPPDVDPSTLSDGFGFKGPGDYDPDNPDKWQVASYMWLPGQMVAYQGDTLNLHFFILNGNEHAVWIEGPDGETVVDETEMNRGREYNMSASVATAGVYRLICNNHEPTMTAEIVVLPRPTS